MAQISVAFCVNCFLILSFLLLEFSLQANWVTNRFKLNWGLESLIGMNRGRSRSERGTMSSNMRLDHGLGGANVRMMSS